VVLRKPDIFNGNIGMFVSSFASLIARFTAVVMGLAVGFVVWGEIQTSALRLERLVEAALFMEGTYFVLLFPSGLWWLGLGFNFLGAAYVLEAACAGSVLMILSFKVRDFKREGTGLLRWVGIAGLGYVTALWFNSVFRWFDQIAVIGSDFLLRGAASWGFLVSLTAMSLAVVFAVPGAYFVAKNKGEAIKWFGLSLLMIGLYYAVYVAYSFTNGNLDSAMQIDVWTLPFIGLGLAFLRMKSKERLI
jgi:hypothetical protein